MRIFFKNTIKRAGNSRIGLLLAIVALGIIIPITAIIIKEGNLRYTNYAAGACTIQVSPGQSIQSALDAVQPGGVICLAPGIYKETLYTKRPGTAINPITIRGTDVAKDSTKRYKTVLHPGSLCNSNDFLYCRNINIDHSYYHLEGFAINGQEGLDVSTYPTDPTKIVAFKNANQSKIKDGRNIYIGSSDTSRDITGVVITNMYIRGAGGECVRMRNNANGNEVSNSVIEYCGMFAKTGDSYLYHNAEAVYLGTSPKSTTQPMYANDQTRNNVVKDNIIHTYGSECFNVKENAFNNSFINNECAYNLEPESYLGSNIELRGHNNTVQGNTIFSSAGGNIKLKSDSTQYDKGGNSIINNSLKQAAGNNIKNEQSSIGKICGNTIDGTVVGVDKTAFTAACTGITSIPPTTAPTTGATTAPPTTIPTTIPGTPQPTGPAAAYPGDVLNTSIWKLNIPVDTSRAGSPDEIRPPELATYTEPRFFYLNTAKNGVIFKSTTGGFTTANSKYPRSELRELVNGGDSYWSPTSGTHSMYIDQKINHLPVVKPHIVVGQIHDASNDVTVFRLEGKKLFIDINGNQGPVLTDNYVLGTRFNVKFEVGGGVVKYYYNGTLLPFTLPVKFSEAYFKAGAYVQSSCTKNDSSFSGESCDAYGEVEIFKLQVCHNAICVGDTNPTVTTAPTLTPIVTSTSTPTKVPTTLPTITPTRTLSPMPSTSVVPTSNPSTCPKKSVGDANCQSTQAGKAVDVLDYAIWYSEFIKDCSSINLAGCGVDSDGDGNAMDANFNYPGTNYILNDSRVSVFDYSIWIQGLSTSQ